MSIANQIKPKARAAKAKKPSVRKSAPVQKAKADLEAKIAPKAKTGSPDIKKLVETIQLGDPAEAAVALEEFFAMKRSTALPELADLRKWAAEMAVHSLPAFMGQRSDKPIAPSNDEITNRAKALVVFVLTGEAAGE